MKQIRKRLSGDLILILGATAITAGVALIYIPAGLIVAGAFAIAGGVLNCIGGNLHDR